MSVYKRLQSFEAAIRDQDLPDIDKEWLSREGLQTQEGEIK
jgi:peptide/bleomycin uptake transporter